MRKANVAFQGGRLKLKRGDVFIWKKTGGSAFKAGTPLEIEWMLSKRGTVVTQRNANKARDSTESRAAQKKREER